MLGDYTAPQEDENIKTVLDGVISKLSPSKVEYVRGCAIRDTTVNEIAEAVEAASRSEVIIAVVEDPAHVISRRAIRETVQQLLTKRVSVTWNVARGLTGLP